MFRIQVPGMIKTAGSAHQWQEQPLSHRNSPTPVTFGTKMEVWETLKQKCEIPTQTPKQVWDKKTHNSDGKYGYCTI